MFYYNSPLVAAAVAAAVSAPAPSFDLNTLVTGGSGAVVGAAVIWLAKLIADRTIPSRSDARANVSLVLEGLNNMVKVLQEEKIADAQRLSEKQTRIDLLESASDKDYDRIGELRAEIIDLRNRLATKDRHINNLVSELRKFGVMVTGIELEDADIEITHSKDDVKRMRESHQSEDDESAVTGR